MPAKLPETEGRRHPMGFRTTSETKTRIEDAARRSGRSVSQEIEARLEYSFAMDRHEQDLKNNPIVSAIDKETEGMFQIMSSAVGAAIVYTNQDWKTDPYSRAAVRSAIISTLSSYFTKHHLDIKPDDIDLALLKQSDHIGSLMGRVLSASKDSPEMRAWITKLASDARPARASEDPPTMSDAFEKEEALKYLIGANAA